MKESFAIMISANLKILVEVYFALRKLWCTSNVPEIANTQVKELCVTFSVTSILLRDQWLSCNREKLGTVLLSAISVATKRRNVLSIQYMWKLWV